jgi:hypothetical protein
MKDQRVMSVIVLLLGLIGCRSNIDRAELPGVYQATYSYGVEHLNVMADGTYEQSFVTTGTPVKSINKGKWELGHGDIWEGDLLILNNPVIVDDGFGKLSKLEQRSGVWQLRVRKSIGGNIYFPINDDQGTSFKRGPVRSGIKN